MIATLDERHIARGYDPYNSADQPHIIAARNFRGAAQEILKATPQQIADALSNVLMKKPELGPVIRKLQQGAVRQLSDAAKDLLQI